jgi:hypothetical protein
MVAYGPVAYKRDVADEHSRGFHRATRRSNHCIKAFFLRSVFFYARQKEEVENITQVADGTEEKITQ